LRSNEVKQEKEGNEHLERERQDDDEKKRAVKKQKWSHDWEKADDARFMGIHDA